MVVLSDVLPKINYRLVRSHRRKTISLQVKNTEVIVRAPYFVADDYIEGLIREKSSWLKQKIAEQSPLQIEQFTQGKSVLIEGVNYQLEICYSRSKVIQDKCARKLYLHLSNRYLDQNVSSEVIQNKIKQQLERWFKQQLSQYIDVRLPILARETGLFPAAIKIRKYKSRWGSCNSRGEVSFNFLLKSMPDWVIDYVVIHELCHLKHMNHSTDFWRLVAKYMPDYQHAQTWIKQHNASLQFL